MQTSSLLQVQLVLWVLMGDSSVHVHLWSSVLSTVLSKGFCPPLRPVPKVAIPPSLWCSGLGRVCPVAIATQAGLSEGAARASQLAEVTAAFPPSLLFRRCSAALGLVHREPVWSGTSLSSRRTLLRLSAPFLVVPVLGHSSIPPLCQCLSACSALSPLK